MIKRKLLVDLKNHLKTKEISLITGPRQSGKTTIMKELQLCLDKEGESTLFLNLDFELDRVHFASQEALLNKLKLEFGKKRGYVFIDEMQRKDDAGLFLKGIYDFETGHKFIVSGSGSLELKEKIHESLAGRKRLFELSTLTFDEFVNFRTSYKYEDRLNDFYRLNAEKTRFLLEDYMNYGGYPRIVLEDNVREKIMLMDEIYRSYIEKDISYLLKIDKTESFSKMIKLLSSQISSLLNYSDIASKSGVSVPTLKHYIWYAKLTFIINEVYPYYSNSIKEITKSPMIYFSDLGMRNYMLGLFGNVQTQVAKGMIFQNFIYKILSEKIKFTPATLHFWRTTDRAEVDFIIKRGDLLIPIEVKYSSLKKEEVSRSFHSFLEKYKPKRAFIVNLTLFKDVQIGDTFVSFMPFYELSSADF